MSDERLRELERRWRTTGTLEDEVACLRERRRVLGGTPMRPQVQLDFETRTARFKIAYVSPTDALRCPATVALVLLHASLQAYAPGEITVIATEGSRTLFFEVDLPQLDLGDVKVRAQVYCTAGPVWSRDVRRLVIEGVAGVVFVPSLVEGFGAATCESADQLVEDLLFLGVEPHTIPIVLQWLPGDSRPEVAPESLGEDLDLFTLASFSTDRRTGSGIEEALFVVLRQARAACLEVNGCP